jgi:putative tryptophan/tyrosine transport system substrate-binding protein
MRLREFIALLRAVAWSAALVGSAQPGWGQAPLPTVAVLRVTGAESARVNVMFREALRSIGHEDGRTIRLMEYTAGNDLGRLPALAENVRDSGPAVVVAMGPAAARAIKAASRSIPIVAFTSFPVEAGLVASLAKPGGNVTGVSLITTELDPKRLSLLAEFVPSAKRIAILRDRAVPANHIPELEGTARTLGLTLDVVEVDRPDDIAAAVNLVKSRGAEALNVLASPMLNGSASNVAASARQAGLPAMCQWREMAEAGCLVSYGPSFMEAYRLTAAQMDRVLRGASPAELPVQQPTRFELIINLTAARALRLDLAPTLLARADEVIE